MLHNQHIDEHRRVDTMSQNSRRTSFASSLTSAKMREEQKMAELQAKASTLRQKQTLEQAKLQLQLQEEALQLESEIAMSNARQKVIERFEVDERNAGESRDVIPLNEDTPNVNIDAHRSRRLDGPAVLELNHDAVPFHPTHDIEPVLVSQRSPIETRSTVEGVIASVVRHLKKPVSDIKKFGGDPLEYNKFLRQFKSKVITNCDDDDDDDDDADDDDDDEAEDDDDDDDDDDERLNYLEQFTFGEANRLC